MEQTRIDLAAFGRDEDSGAESVDARQRAEVALAHAAGALRFIDPSTEDPVASEFRALYEAVAPILARP